MTTLIQISDTHFGTERAAVVDALIELVHRLAPDLVVLSGDITQRARAHEFAAAAAFVKRLAAPRVLAIPGNHDIALFDLMSRLSRPYAGFRSVFGDDLEPIFDSADCLALTVKTTRRYRHVDGEISEAQRERVAARLRRAPAEQVRLVVVHQPLAVPRDSEQKNVVHGHAAAIDAWAEAGADVVLAGHIHLPFILPLHELQPALPRRLWAVNAGTAVSSRTRHDAGNSVNVVLIDSARPRPNCTIREYTYASPNAGFSRRSSVELELGERRASRSSEPLR
jgi:3',5'-cyclic AMP phosphodiesterase CpdA